MILEFSWSAGGSAAKVSKKEEEEFDIFGDDDDEEHEAEIQRRADEAAVINGNNWIISYYFIYYNRLKRRQWVKSLQLLNLPLSLMSNLGMILLTCKSWRNVLEASNWMVLNGKHVRECSIIFALRYFSS
jgi:hypothetical protein